MSATTSRPIAIKLDLDIRERIKRLAEARHRSTHLMMRDAIAQFIEREERREPFRQEGIRAWNEYKATGLQVTLEEADKWMAKLEAGDDVAPPCMSRLIWSPAALRDVHRVYRFLAPKKIDAAKCAVKAIRDGDRVLALQREIARTTQNMDSGYRE